MGMESPETAPPGLMTPTVKIQSVGVGLVHYTNPFFCCRYIALYVRQWLSVLPTVFRRAQLENCNVRCANRS